MSKPVQSAPEETSLWLRLYPLLCGAFFGLGLVKFGNPVILDQLIEPPKDGYEFVFQTWPTAWGYGLLALVVLGGAMLVRFNTTAPKWVAWMPLVWLGWQMISAGQSVKPALTHATVPHFAACVACFYLGMLVVGRLARATLIWPGLLAGLVVLLFKGFSQHYGELEQTRKFVLEQTDWHKLPPEMIARLASDRIFATFFGYPNAFAGAILLLAPGAVIYLMDIGRRWPKIARGVTLGLFIYMALACVYWTGSKAGWLIGLAMGLVVALQLPLPRKARMAIIGIVLIGGLAGFVIKYQTYLQKGATSVGARFDYWKVALQVANEHPLLGTGPGTFQVLYQKLKPPAAEMARLAHNDYLEQASDSGWVGFLCYTVLMVGSVVFLYRKSKTQNTIFFASWLGFFGIAVQGAVEFWLYVPAIAWTAFLLLGWLWGIQDGVSQKAELKSTTPP